MSLLGTFSLTKLNVKNVRIDYNFIKTVPKIMKEIKNIY